MKAARENVLVLGTGFGGCLIATLLQQLGYHCRLLDPQRHPRFALGESSTPIADAVLERLAHRFDLNELLPLARYGSWKSRYPQVGVGKKRGFSYFYHQPEQPFVSDQQQSHQLLVAASPSDELSDTHWYRHDVDPLFLEAARTRGVEVYEGVQNLRLQRALTGGQLGWIIQADIRAAIQADAGMAVKKERPARHLEFHADWVVDATGRGSVVARTLGLKTSTDTLQTCSRSVFTHMRGLPRWQQVLQEQGIDCAPHPFACDDAAIHHILREGWMWQLPFDHGITSVGLMLAGQAGGESAHGSRDSRWAAAEGATSPVVWREVLERYPSLRAQFANAEVVLPEPGWRVTERVQFLWEQGSGDDWIGLPAAIGQIDALHSTGIAHTLYAIERLVEWLGRAESKAERAEVLCAAGEVTVQELRWIDSLVSATYAARGSSRTWAAACMLYFAAATHFEYRRAATESVSAEWGALRAPLFLGADQPELRAVGATITRRAQALGPRPSAGQQEQFEREVRQSIEPFNRVGLFDPPVPNMYSATVAPTKLGMT